MTEVELKFAVPEAQRGPLRAAVLALLPARVHLQARYHDTAHRDLARHALALRLRLEGNRWMQTLKASGDSPAARHEHNAEIPGPRAGVPALDLGRHAGSPAHARLMAVLGDPPAALTEGHRTDVTRLTLQLRRGKAHVELALDVGHLLSGEASRPVHEVEFELKNGSVADLFAVALPWVQQFGLWLDVVSKGERGELLSRGQAHAGPTHASPPGTVSADPRRFARQAVAACLEQVLRNASDVAAGSDDPDHVHQLRVGLRRLRTALRELPQLNARLDPGWEAELAGAFRELGELRDQAILASKTGRALADAGAPRLEPDAPRLPGPASADSLVRAWPLQRTLLALLEFTLEETGPGDLAFEGDALDAVRARLDRLHAQIRKAARRFVEMPADDQHAVRKRLKRLRYLAEFVAPAFPKAKVSAYFDELKPAQDALGEHNDEATALDHFRTRAARDPQAWFAVGWLTARQEVSARAAAKALRRAGEARPFWRGKPRKKARSPAR